MDNELNGYDACDIAQSLCDQRYGLLQILFSEPIKKQIEREEAEKCLSLASKLVGIDTETLKSSKDYNVNHGDGNAILAKIKLLPIDSLKIISDLYTKLLKNTQPNNEVMLRKIDNLKKQITEQSLESAKKSFELVDEQKLTTKEQIKQEQIKQEQIKQEQIKQEKENKLLRDNNVIEFFEFVNEQNKTLSINQSQQTKEKTKEIQDESIIQHNSEKKSSIYQIIRKLILDFFTYIGLGSSKVHPDQTKLDQTKPDQNNLDQIKFDQNTIEQDAKQKAVKGALMLLEYALNDIHKGDDIKDINAEGITKNDQEKITALIDEIDNLDNDHRHLIDKNIEAVFNVFCEKFKVNDNVNQQNTNVSSDSNLSNHEFFNHVKRLVEQRNEQDKIPTLN